PLPRDRDARLARRDERRALARALEGAHDLERGRHLADGGIAADRQDDVGPLARPAVPTDGQVRRRIAELAHRPVATSRGLGERWIRQHALVQTVPHAEAALEGPREEWPVRVGDAPTRGGGTDEQHLRAA